jgi:BirA family biotin operon repressor/biotin-[acetyl-CoA-carboxylase] ligase
VPDRGRLTAEILNELERVYGQLETGEFLEESRRRSNVIGRDVLVIEGGRQYPARALDIDDRGHLVIRDRKGNTSSLGFGEVSLKLK